MTRQEQIAEHEENLSKFFNHNINYEELKKLDDKAHIFAEHCCSYEISEIEQEEQEKYFMSELLALIGSHNKDKVFYNGDPRGFTFKIPHELVNKFYETDKISIYRDWGGYGIIAPDFRD